MIQEAMYFLGCIKEKKWNSDIFRSREEVYFDLFKNSQ